MKMSQSDFDALKKDFLAVVDLMQATRGPINYSATRTMWDIFHVVELDRTSDDSHPIYGHGAPIGRPRYVAHVGHKASLYNKGYNDAHIETALRKIVSA